ncbi:MAG: 3-deoxy-manno-octulosonate cytidylyltransferase [Lautropia sp.]|nr:3-deoxy-manno-octulosonate cytidylyltransferase [Lautropia sp.]
MTTAGAASASAASAASATSAAYVVLIPARLASTRLPDKPLADIAGKPMIVRVAEQAARSSAARVVVAADSSAVADAVRQAGFEVVITRLDHRSGTDRLAEAAGILGLADDVIVVNMQGDEPELPPALLDKVAQCLAQDADCVMATAAHAIDNLRDWFNPNVVKVVLDSASRALYFSRAPIPYHRDGLRARAGSPDADADADADALRALAQARPLRHIGLYAYRGQFLKAYSRMATTALEGIEALEQLRVLFNGFSIKVVVATQAPAAGVDTPEDLAAVRRRFGA